MPQIRELNGIELEDWFRSFAQRTGILDTQSFKLEEVVKLFDRHLNKRFADARPHIKVDFPYGNEWIDTILQGRPLSKVDDRIKQQLASKLLDLTLATDLVIKVKDEAGKDIRIAVDVTWNNSRKSEKIGKVRGLPKRNQETTNQNQNVPVIRKRLGITKHLVLVFDNQTNKLPNDEKLLFEINNFAKANSLTNLVNFRNLPEQERFDWESYACDPKKLWDECSPGIKERTAIETSVTIATKAMRKGHSPETVSQMMVHDPEYKRLLKLNQGALMHPEGYARFIVQKASDLLNRELANPKTQHDMNLRGLNAVRAIISTAGEGIDGKQVFESSKYELTQQGSAFSLHDTVGQRGTILEFSQGVLEGSITGADGRELEKLNQSFQQEQDSQQQKRQQPERGQGRSL